MKNLIVLLTLVVFVQRSNAQSIYLPNGDFEKHFTLQYDDLIHWHTSNLYSNQRAIIGITTIQPASGIDGNGCVHLETLSSPTDTIAGYISNTNGDITKGEGGVPFTMKAKYIAAWYKYDIKPLDAAYIYVIFKKNGQIISNNTYTIPGGSKQSNYKWIFYPVDSMIQAPDSVIVAAVSSNITGLPQPGSWIEIDSIQFNDGNSLAALPHGGFDYTEWKYPKDSINLFDFWAHNSDGGEVVKTTDKHNGDYAMKLVSHALVNSEIRPGIIILDTTATREFIVSYTKKTDTLAGYYKYETNGNDNGVINITLKDKNKQPILPVFTHKLMPVSGYTYFEVPINSTDTPSYMTLEIMSSDMNGSPSDSSTLFIDDLIFKNTPVDIQSISQDVSHIMYPNPVDKYLHVDIGISTKELAQVTIFDINGRVVAQEKHEVQGNVISIPVNEYPSGIFTYELRLGEDVFRNKFLKR